jgi:crotonobetainyl-CoA:carnitine CoA-transferase CaiB-like acyl-CoA transferase
MSSRPLSGIAVLDLGDDATVFGARLLAELGADVVRVEDLRGDSVRRRGPFLKGVEGIERSLAHLLFNAGKRSVAVDLESPRGWAAVERVAAACDAVIAPLHQTEAHRRLFAAMEARADGPGVVDAVFRRGMPMEVATDLVATAAGGLLTLNGFPDDPPNYPAGELGYKELSLAAAQAALSLMMERQQTGRAGRITVSLQEAVNFTTLQTANANWLHWQGRVPGRKTPLSPLTTFKTGDGRWVSFTIHPPNWPRYADWVASELGATDLLAGEWNDAGFRATRFKEIAGFTETLCARHTLREVLDEGQRRGLLTLPVNSVEDIANDAHLIARGFYERVAHPHLGEEVVRPRSAFLSTIHDSGMGPAPQLGADTESVLRELAGLSREECDALFGEGLVSGSRSTMAAATPARTPAGPSAARTTPRHQPLKGVRILDFCWAIAGPLGTRLLADLGADVIKVESEYRLDPIRQIGVQPPGEPSWNTNGQYNDCNTNKRAFTLNLNTPEGIAIARRLAATADVVTSNYTPDRLDRWGLGYEALREIRPDIIVANWAVMGVRGPHAGWRSYGSGIVAMSGLADLTGFPGRDPIGLGTLHTDFTVPYFAALQVMAAVMHRERTGEGQYVEIAQYESAVHLLDTELVELLNNGSTPGRDGNRSRRFAPHGVFPAAGEDRWVAIACRDDADWSRMQGVPGLEALKRISDRSAQVDEVEAAIAAWTATRDRWEAAATLQAAGVPASAVEDLADLLGEDTAMNADYQEVALPSGVTAIVQEQPITWDGERLPIRRAPLWGEHTDVILRDELGYSDDEIAEFAAKNVLY